MASLRPVVDYLQDLAVEHTTVQHNLPINAENRNRRSFIAVEDEDALEAAMSTGIDFPCVAMRDITGRILDKNDSIRKDLSITLWFLVKIDEAEPTETAKQAAYDEAEEVMNDFISRMYNDFEDEVTCGFFSDIDTGNFVFDKTGRVSDNCYGWRLQFRFEQRATDITTYDSAKWQGGTGTTPGGGSGGDISYVASGSGTVATPTGSFFTYHVNECVGVIWNLYLSSACTVDWGDDSPIMNYPAQSIVQKQYSEAGPFEMKVYYGSGLLDMWLQSSGAGKLTLIDGTIPSNLQRVELSNGLTVMPALPSGCNLIKVYNCSLNTAALDGLIAHALSTNLTSGYLRLMNQNPIANISNIDGVYTLQNRGWFVDFN